jgi:outer membrane protein TolC
MALCGNSPRIWAAPPRNITPRNMTSASTRLAPVPSRFVVAQPPDGVELYEGQPPKDGEIPSPTPPAIERPSKASGSPQAENIEAGQAEIEKIRAENPESILGPEVTPIDLQNALRLAGVQNPDLQIARQRVVESAAMRQYMAAQILPSLNAGWSFDDHTGVLQQSDGKILNVNRSSMFVGAGANAIAAGTVNIPGVQWNLQTSNTIFNILVARQTVQQRRFESLAARNQILGDVAVGYVELLRTAGRRAIAVSIRDQTAEIARMTAAYAKDGQGRAADANRAATELTKRNRDILQAESEVLQTSARLCQLLNLDPSTRLQPTDGWVVPAPIVPSPMPLSEQLALALLRRPELAVQRAAVEQALLQLRAQRILPFAPQLYIGVSGGTFGGGSNLTNLTNQPRFGSFASRSDIDLMAYWTLQNLGVGNRAQINAARARLGVSNYEQLRVLNQVRMEVTEANARSNARFAQIATAELAVVAGAEAYREDLVRIRNAEGLPIEVLDSLRLWGRAREVYLTAVADYNEAQFDLYVAMGQPPADTLARPIPTDSELQAPPANQVPEPKQPAESN